jgi:hypothetical protein
MGLNKIEKYHDFNIIWPYSNALVVSLDYNVRIENSDVKLEIVK